MSDASFEKPFTHIVFDLDDTLLDTYRQLIPRASRDACTAMISAGLNTGLDSCLNAWQEHGQNFARREIFTHLVGYFGVREGTDSEIVARRGYHAFYNRKVESDISLFKGARELLNRLHRDYTLHLVTSGARATQEEKIRILDIGHLFSSISHVDPAQRQTKHEAFKEIARRTQDPPERFLSVGNRVDTDVAEARALGWKAAWVRYGEHASMQPNGELEKAEFVIENILELPTVCRL